MKYLALTVFLAIVQAAAPVPRKTPDAPASGNQAIEKDSSTKQTPPNPALPVKDASSSHPDKQSSNTPPNADAGKTILISESTSVPMPHKDWWDKAYVVFTGLLVLVGSIGIRYALRTLKAVERQALSMRRQTTHLKIAANAARNSAEFAERATKASERADILLVAASISPLGPVTGDSQLKVRYKNFGRTRAKDVRFKIELLIEGLNLAKGNLQLPAMNMGAGQDQTITFQTFRECLALPLFKEIVGGERTLRFVASAVYEDVFGDSYTTMDIGVFDRQGLRFRIEQQIAG